MGPLELLAVRFPGNKFRGEIAASLAELVENGTIRVIDILFAMKDEEGRLIVAEINDLEDDVFAAFDPVVDDDLTGMLSADDVHSISSSIENNSSVALMLFENTWATRFRDAMIEANGELILNERIPKAAVDEMVGMDSLQYRRAA